MDNNIDDKSTDQPRERSVKKQKQKLRKKSVATEEPVGKRLHVVITSENDHNYRRFRDIT